MTLMTCGGTSTILVSKRENDQEEFGLEFDPFCHFQQPAEGPVLLQSLSYLQRFMKVVYGSTESFYVKKHTSAQNILI